MSKKPIVQSVTKNLPLTPEEANVLLSLLSTAVKHVGLDDGGQTAQNGMVLIGKIQQAFKITPAQDHKEQRDNFLKSSKGGKK